MQFHSLLDRAMVSLGRAMGYRVEKEYCSSLNKSIPEGAKLYVGCGDQELEGYFGCDLRPLPHVALSCKAWEVSSFCENLSEIYSRHMLEHLTYEESMLTLRDWHRALGPGGVVRIEVPNIRFALKQWLSAEWTAESWDQRYSNARWGFANLFGWQRECNPTELDYNNSYWDVHKSGYDEVNLRYFLNKAGFDEVEIHLDSFTPAQMRRRKLSEGASDGCHLVATAVKSASSSRMAA